MNPSTLYRKFVARKYAYRVVPESHLAAIKKRGIVFGKDPYKKFHADIEALFRVVLRFEKKGFHLMRWWGQPTLASRVIKTSRRDIRKQFIDFTCIHHHVNYYRKLRGGALMTTVHLFAHELLAKGVPLTDTERTLCKRVMRFTTRLRTENMAVIKVPLTEHVFQTAHFATPDKKRLPSPFGSEAHFTKIRLENIRTIPNAQSAFLLTSQAKRTSKNNP